MKEILKIILIGICIGLAISGVILSIVYLSKDNYAQMFFHIITLGVSLSALIYFSEKESSTMNQTIKSLTATAMTISLIIAIFKVIPAGVSHA